MSKVVGRLNDWNTTLTVERGWNMTHLIIREGHGDETEIELNKLKVKELIKMLEEAIR